MNKDNHYLSFSSYLVSQLSIGDHMTERMRLPLLILGIHMLAQSPIAV